MMLPYTVRIQSKTRFHFRDSLSTYTASRRPFDATYAIERLPGKFFVRPSQARRYSSVLRKVLSAEIAR